jgi:hypothetical protein
MSLGITETIGSAMPVVSAACFIAAGAFVGRKVICGLVCKAGSKVADLMGKPNAAEWNQASADYFAQAKKDAPRDFAAATGLVLCGLFAKHAGETLKEAPPKPEPTKYEKYIAPAVGFVVDYKKPIIVGITALGIFAGIKKFYNKPIASKETVITNIPRNFKITKKEFIKTLTTSKNIPITQETFNGAYGAAAVDTNIVKSLVDSIIKQITTLNTELPSIKNIASKYGLGTTNGLGTSNYAVPIPSFESMQAAYQFNK